MSIGFDKLLPILNFTFCYYLKAFYMNVMENAFIYALYYFSN